MPNPGMKANGRTAPLSAALADSLEVAAAWQALAFPREVWAVGVTAAVAVAAAAAAATVVVVAGAGALLAEREPKNKKGQKERQKAVKMGA